MTTEPGKGEENSWPFVSVLIPCLNECAFIGPCLDSVLANDYPPDRLEILVVDGDSQDGTGAILSEYSQRDPRIRVLKNPRRSIPAALNIGIISARGEVVARLDAHAYYNRRYLHNCVQSLDRLPAASVGGVWKVLPRKDTLLGRAIAAAYTHPFGIGNAAYRTGDVSAPREVDTVPFFCCRTPFVRELGPYNEKLTRSEDMEFNARLKKRGGKIFIIPNVICYYYARSDGLDFLVHSFKNGVFITAPWLEHARFFFSVRHVVPLFFSITFLGAAAVAFLSPHFRTVAWLTLAPYGVASMVASVHVALVLRRWEYLLTMPGVFFGLHFFYGLGSLWGIFVGLAARWKSQNVQESATL